MGIFRKLLRDRRGMAAVEFAFVAPLLIVLFIGLFETSSAIIVYMKVIDAADTVSDLVSQQESVASSDFDNLYTAAQMIMTPSSGTPLKVAIASIAFDPQSGNPSIAWHVERGGATAITDATAATGLGDKGDSVIEATATYSYTSAFSKFLPLNLTFSTRVFTRPRLVTSVSCTSGC